VNNKLADAKTRPYKLPMYDKCFIIVTQMQIFDV